MFKQFSFSKCRAQARRGWTLVEMMVSMVGGGTVLASMLVTSGMMSNSMLAIINYDQLNQASRKTLDLMSRDLRNTSVVTQLSSSRVVVTNSITGDSITYAWDGQGQFTRTYNGVSTVMLTGCDTLTFQGFQRNPTNNLCFLPASVASQTKLISVSWRCSRKILGAKLNTESVQTAQICIRN
jgi:Tfp pilus assembly protein PilW